MREDFWQSRRYENAQQEAAEREIVRRFGAVAVMGIRWTEGEEDKLGTDCVVELPWEEVRLDWKFRRNDYGDLLIEYEHITDGGDRTSGWIEKQTTADYLVYLPEGAEAGDWLPTDRLWKAWEENKDEWLDLSCEDTSRIETRKNQGYRSRSLAISKEALYAAMKRVK